ncbi:MAG: glycoside hydrolase family 3 C-terminal domain-containing protein, partial [Bacilli bacterium]|nr:glycoside hydrolase family 3 C-terminal domain-containing protein [Bacilli bacterium]
MKDHLSTVLNNAGECTVLLKTNGKFPIEKPCKIAAFGSGVRYTISGGTGSGDVNVKKKYTIEERLEREGFEITSKQWLDKYDQARIEAKKVFLKEVRKEAKERHENLYAFAMGKEMYEPYYDINLSYEGEAAIYVVSRISGEGGDRKTIEGDVYLTKSEIRDILELNKRFDKFMLVLNVGGVVDLSPVMEVENILLLSQLGIDSGKVLADILLGKQNPSGKLATTWAKYMDYSHEGTFGDWNDNIYKEGIYVGYRYFDTFNKPVLFPFGYGLSFTKFEHKVLNVAIDKDIVTVKINVKNVGQYKGKEVIQAYITLPEGKLDKAYQELAGFNKTSELLPGKDEDIDIIFSLKDLASYDIDIEGYILEAGNYLLRVGNSSKNTKVVAVLSLNETVTTLKTRNSLGSIDFEELKAPNRKDENIPDDAIRLTISS